GEARIRRRHARAQRAERIIRQGLAENARKRAQDRPILARIARREDGAARELDPALGVDVGRVLLGVSGSRKHHIGARGAAVAMVPLIDNESIPKPRRVDLVGAEEIEELDLAAGAAGENAGDVAPACAWNKAEI